MGVPHSVAEINRKSLTSDPLPGSVSSDCLAGFTTSDGSEVDARLSASPNVPRRQADHHSTTTSESDKSKDPSPNPQSKMFLGKQGPGQRKQSNPRKEMHEKLMNEALLKVEVNKSKGKTGHTLTRNNPTITAM